MWRLSDKDFADTVKFAKKYPFEAVREYLRDAEFANWMNDVMVDPDAEMFSNDDLKAINAILVDVFELSHGRLLDYGTRRELIDFFLY